MSKPPPISRTRHNLGESFLFALDDIRQKIVEEAWTGSTQTPSAQLHMQYSDFVAWLYGSGAKPAVPGAGVDTHAAALGDLRQWASAPPVAQPPPPEIEPEGPEL